MFRPMFRVVVAASVVLSFTIFAVPSAQAGPSRAKAPVVENDSELLPAIIYRLLGISKPKKPKSPTAGEQYKADDYGSCIDPWGRPKPCT